MRYQKASIICGFLAFLVSAGLFELGAFRGLDAALATFVEQPTPPVVGKVAQYILMLAACFGIAWTTIDIGRISLKLTVFFLALAECVTAVWVFDLFERYFSPFATLTALLVSFVFAFLYSQSKPGRRKQALQDLLGARVSRATFDTLLNCDVPLKFDGEVREATVVICEVFNHEELMGSMRINDYVAMTNAFLQNGSDLLVQHGGYLDECDGNCLRVVFGAPLPDSKHAVQACEAAMALVERLDAVNKECHQLWGQMFDYRVGINSGEMVIAAYGAARPGNLSVAGEPVEFARRLCAANTIYGSKILVGAATFNEAETGLEVRPMEIIQRHSDAAQREEVYELLGLSHSISDAEKMRREHFWKGVILFRGQHWDDALGQFHRAVEILGHDGPSEFYIRRIEQHRNGQPSLDWTTARL